MAGKPRICFVETSDHIDEIQKELSPLADEIKIFTEELSDVAGEAADCEIISPFIHSRIGPRLFGRLPNLKLLATRSTGYDHIDIEAAGQRRITVTNTPYYGENTVAEHTFALILALSRNVHRAYVRTQKNDFSLEGLVGFDLKHRTLGVIGAGHIGLYVIKMAKGFGMDVLAYDVNQDHFIAEVLGFQYAGLDDLLANADVISLHAPYNAKTHHLINRDNIAKIKPGSLLINTARGGLIDTKALVWALDKGILGGAGLDVLEGEELIADELEVLSAASKKILATLVSNHVLLNRENVVITPHIAFYSREAVDRIWETTIANIKAYIAGRPENVVNTQPKAA